MCIISLSDIDVNERNLTYDIYSNPLGVALQKYTDRYFIR